jgi:beta-glucanase (GH16 family)
VLLALLGVISVAVVTTGTASASTSPFRDVAPSSPFYGDITWSAQHGLVTGYADGTFRQGADVSRQAFAAYLYRYAHGGTDAGRCTGAAPFPDVPTTSGFCGDIAWLTAQHLTNGYADGGFHPTAPITRQALAATFNRYNHAGAGGPCTGTSRFPDVAATSPFCADIRWLADASPQRITTGNRDGGFHPGEHASRQATVAYLHRYDADFGDGCGGAKLVKPDGTPWVCTFDDEFDTTTGTAGGIDRSKWLVQLSSNSALLTGTAPYRACYVDSPDNVSVSGGNLNLTVRKEATPLRCAAGRNTVTTQYTAGMVSTAYHFSQTYGRFEVRARLPQPAAPGGSTTGLQETFWLWPDNAVAYGAFPYSGEIDFAEFFGNYNDRVVPYLHYMYDPATVNLASNTNVFTNNQSCRIDLTRFNVYAVEWSPGMITVSYNGNTCLVDDYVATGLSGAAPFDQPFFVALTQALGVGANTLQPGSTPLPATTQVDYVRVWK